ncbi:MAG: DUF362 domain-containing protein [Clostridia bacterium]|nr:DUF362 domain-containing protein [Clostridia bacterium]
MGSKVAIATGKDRVQAVRTAFQYLGGIEQWVKPGYKVLIKPNVMTAMGTPTVTHIDVIKGLILLCQEAGAGEITVAENSVCGMSPRVHFEYAGYTRAIEDLGAQVHFFDEGEWVYVAKPDNYCLQDMHLPRKLMEADVWITVPVAKTHESTLTTLGIKNSHGILPDEDKARHHRTRPESGSSLWDKFVDILATKKPDLCVTDMYEAMEGQGPAFGSIVTMKLIVASSDVVACDAVVEALMGLDNLEGPLTRLAHERGLGVGDINQIEIVGEPLAEHRRPFARAVSDPVINCPPGLTILRGDVCKGGCQMPLRYAIDVSNIIYAKDHQEFGDVYILVGMYPPPPPEDKFVVAFGDCAIYTTWHYSYRQKPKKVGPWFNPRRGYVDVIGCCPLGLVWVHELKNLTKGYAPMVLMAGGSVGAFEEPSANFNFGTGVPPEKQPRRWHWDRKFAERFAKEIAESKPATYIYAANESMKGKARPEVARNITSQPAYVADPTSRALRAKGGIR